MIGGTDVVLWVREDLPASDFILRTVRRHWPDLVFQDADDPTLPSQSLHGWLPQPSGREFFVYRDLPAALSWHEHGAIPENTNAMLHVILGNRRKPEAGLRSLTIVCGDLSGEMKSMIDEVEIAFSEATLENTSWM